jgi:hypothetical protein
MQPQRGREPGALPSQLVAHRSWLPAGALLSAHLAVSAYGDRPLLTALVLGVVTVVAFFFCTLAHGYSHITIARLTGAPRSSARLTIFGDVVDSGPSDAPAVVAAAGPAVSTLIGLGLLVLSWNGDGTLSDIGRTLAFANLGVAVVNLIPGTPMDLGRVVATATGRPRFAAMLGRLFGLLMLVVGALLLFQGRAVLEVAALGGWLLLVGFFMLLEARPPKRAPGPVIDISGQTVGAWTRPFVGRLNADDPAPGGEGPFAVSDEGRLAGVIARPVRPGARARDAMVAWTSDLGIRSDVPLERAIERLAKGQEPLIVVDERGVVRGVLDESAVRTQLVER